MPTLTRWFVKTALVCLVAALLLGALLAGRPVFDLPESLDAFWPIHIHLLTVGWTTQLIFGVAFWMFPKAAKDRPRGSEALGWVCYAALNAGLALRAAAEPAVTLALGGPWGALLALSAALQLLAVLAFAANTWARVRER